MRILATIPSTPCTYLVRVRGRVRARSGQSQRVRARVGVRARVRARVRVGARVRVRAGVRARVSRACARR